MLVDQFSIISSRMVSLLGFPGLLLDRLKLKLPAERAKDAEAPLNPSTLQGALLSQPEGLGLRLWQALQEHSPGTTRHGQRKNPLARRLPVGSLGIRLGLTSPWGPVHTDKLAHQTGCLF